MKFDLYTPGTRVIYTRGLGIGSAPIAKGEGGTIKAMIEREGELNNEYAYDLGVDWDEPSEDKHDCGGLTRPKHGWWVYNGDVTFELKKEPKKKRRKDL